MGHGDVVQSAKAWSRLCTSLGENAVLLAAKSNWKRDRLLAVSHYLTCLFDRILWLI